MPRNSKILSALMVFLLSGLMVHSINAQDISSDAFLDSLQITTTVPEELLNGKSLMLIQGRPLSENNDLRSDYFALAQAVQPEMRRLGIDVVGVYNIQDISSGSETASVFKLFFADRNITHLVIVREEQTQVEILISPFSKATFIDQKQPSWKTTAPDLRGALSRLSIAVSNSGQERTNLLILEEPEKGPLFSPIKGRRSEFYDLNLQSDKLAVIPFADTAQISEIMNAYPYKYEFVSPQKTEKEIRAEGFQFILHYVHATGASVRELLEYDTLATDNKYISQSYVDDEEASFPFDKNQPVYKFYIKHIYSGNVFLGKNYDAAPEWQQSLNLYIANLRKELINN